MGQKLGKSSVLPMAVPFTRLPKRAVDLVWRELNIIAEGFALKEDEFVEICACLRSELELTEEEMGKISSKMFTLLDTDQNGLIDALEFFGAVAAFSGMRQREIFEAVMSCYDFDGTKSLSLDEVVLSLKCVTTGLAKMCMEIPPREAALEELVTPVFTAAAKAEDTLFYTERISIIIDFMMSNPDVSSWFAYFRAADKGAPNTDASLFHVAKPWRTAVEKNALNWNLADKYVHDKHEEAEGSWRHAAESLQPFAYNNFVFKTKAPDASLRMEWVYGYESIRTKNSVHYLYQGDVIYTVGRYAVMYSIINDRQRIFDCHTDDIVCLAVHPDGKHIATVDCEDNSQLYVWNSETSTIEYGESILGSHGASDVVFSADGKLVCVVATDMYHTVSVYNWSRKEEILCSPVSRTPVLCCAFSNEHTLAVGGKSFIYFWAKAAEGHHMRKGIVLARLEKEDFTSITRIGTGNSMLVGSGSGHLILMTDINCVKVVDKAHTGAVTNLFNCRHGILSGGADAKIRMWSQRLVPGVVIDCSIYAPLPAIRSVSMSVDGSTVLFGTLGSCICEVSSLDGANVHLGPIVSSHYTGTINAVAVHPQLHLFASAGEDGTVRLWDMEKRRLVDTIDTGYVITSICFGTTATSETILVVGYGGTSDQGKCGAFAVYDAKMKLLHEAMDATVPITSMKFSPDSEMLAVGFHDGAIFLYAVADDYELIGRCAKHELPVRQIDYSKDGEYIRSNSLQKDIAFFNADDASLMDNFPSMRDIEWVSFSCIYSWHSKSIHRSTHSGEEVCCASTPSAEANFIASATNFGYVRLHSFPCVHEDAEYHRYAAHTSEVAGMCFTPDKKSFVTVGSRDRTIIQWGCREFSDLEPEPREDEPAETNDYAFEARDGHQLRPDFTPENASIPCTLLQAKPKSKPAAGSWRANVIAPSKPGSHNKAVPDAALHLDHVYGLTTQGMRNNVRYNSNGDIVYPCSRIGVVQKKQAGSQVFFDRHTDRISAFAMSRDRKYAASGQHGHKASVAVWDAITGASLRVLDDLQQNGTSALAFSKSSQILAVAGVDDDHAISVYDWKQGVLISRGNGGGHHIFQIAFSHDGTELLSCGIKDMKVWNFKTRAASFVRPSFGEFTPPHPEGEELDENGEEKEPLPSVPLGYAQPFLTCSYFGGRPVVGTLGGELYVFTNNILLDKFDAHPGGVSVMSAVDEKARLVTGGPDGLVNVWNTNFEKVSSYHVEAYVLTSNTCLQSAILHPQQERILVAVRGGEVFEIDMLTSPDFQVLKTEDGEDVEMKSFVADTTVLVKGHHSRELWGLDVHPDDERFVTTGDDGMLHIWDVRHRDVVKTIKIETPSRCVAYSPNGEFIAIGFGSGGGKRGDKEGSYTVLATHGYKVVHEGKDSSEPIRAIRFSPNSGLLAVGSEDTRIYIYNTEDAYSRRATVDSHKAPVLNIDFSTDGQFLMSVDSTNTVMYCDANTGENVANFNQFRDESWATFSCISSWSSQGAWFIQPPDIEPKCISVSHDGKYMAVGNSGGRLQIVNYPSPAGAGFTDQLGHSGSISSVKWLVGDSCILSIGAKDTAVMQWKVTFDDEMDPATSGGASNQEPQVARDCGEEIHGKKKAEEAKARMDPSWISSIQKPVKLQDQRDAPPEVDAELYFTSGARLSDTRETLHYNENGMLVFIAGNTGVVFDRIDGSQIAYRGHRNAIVCLDVDHLGRYAATGDYGTTAELHVWDARTGGGLIHFSSMHKKACIATSFSSDGHHLISLGKEDIQSLLVYTSASGRWWDATILCSCQVTSSKCLWAKFVHGNEYPIVVGGDKFISFFRPSGRSLERKRGVFGSDQQKTALLCVVEGAYAKGGHGERKLLVGAASGDILQWFDRRLVTKIQVHNSAVFALTKLRNGHGYVSASKDGDIKVLNNKLNQTAAFNARALRPQPGLPACHALHCNPSSTKIAVGCRGGEIYEICLATNSTMGLIEGHYQGEVHGLALNPTNPDEYVTAGDDAMICVWKISTKVCIRKASVDSPARAIAWSPDGTRLAVGLGDGSSKSTKDGAFMILDALTLDILFEDRKSKLMISDVKFSPDGERLEFGSRDGRIYFHGAKSFKLGKTAVLGTKGARVNRFDFSKESTFIRVSSDQEELDHFNAATGNAVTDVTTYKNLSWATHDCPYAYQTKGVWKLSEGGIRKVTCTTVSESKALVVACYSDGAVSLYRYPCVNDNAHNISVHSTSFGAARAQFTDDGQYLLILEPVLRNIIIYRLT